MLVPIYTASLRRSSKTSHDRQHQTQSLFPQRALTDDGRGDLRSNGLGCRLCLSRGGGSGGLRALGGRRGGYRLDQRLLLLDELPLDVLERRPENGATSGGGRLPPACHSTLSEEARRLQVGAGGAGLGGDVEGLRRGEQEAQEDDGRPHVCDVQELSLGKGGGGGRVEERA